MSGLDGFAGGWLPVALAVTWKSSLFLVLAAAMAFLARRYPAAVRHLVWVLAFVGVLAMPSVSLLGPGLSVPVPGWPTVPVPGRESVVTPVVATGVADRASTRAAVPAAMGGERGVGPAEGADRVAAEDARRSSQKPSPAASAPVPYAAVNLSAPTHESTSVLAGDASTSWPTLLFMLWLAGFLGSMLVIVVGIVRVWLLARRARPLADERVRRRAAELAGELGAGDRVRLLEAETAVMPMTWGVRRASILLPRQATEWHPSLLDAVLLHELAHVRRHDVLAQLLAGVACAVHWFNPLVWWSAGRLREESELACDDIGARGLASRPEYANELVELARSLRSERRLTVAAIALARRPQLTSRVIALLDDRRSHAGATRSQRWAAVMLGSVVGLPLSVLVPKSPEPAVPVAAAAPLGHPGPSLPIGAAPAEGRRQERAALPVVVTSPQVDPVETARRTRQSSTVSLSGLEPELAGERSSGSGAAADPVKEDEMRAHPSSIIALATGLTLAAASVDAQSPTPAPATYTIAGTVTDSLTGRPIADAAVAFRPAYKAVMTDSLGRFMLKGVKSPQQKVFVQQLGYEEQTLAFEAVDPVSRLDVRLNPDPVVLKGLTVVVRDYHRMLKRMSVGRVYERRDLLEGNLGSLGVFLAQSGAIQPVSGARFGRSDVDSVWVRGRKAPLTLTFDDQPVFSRSFGGLPGYPMSEIYAVIVGPGGGSVAVITNWYLEYLARTGRRLPM